MEWCLSRLLTLALVATSQAWVLQTTNNQITPGSTRDVELICSQGNAPQTTIISEIRITKEGPFGSKTTFAQIVAGNHKESVDENNVTVTGEINLNGGSFLRVEWQIASYDTPGAYDCEIDVFDSLGKLVCLHAKPILIQEKCLTVDDVNEFISNVTSGYEERQKTLELEIAKLKTFIDSELKTEVQQINDINETLASEKTSLNESLKLAYSTKAEVSLQMSDLRISILHEIMRDKNQSLNQYVYDELNSTIHDLKHDVLEKIDSMKTNIKSVDDQVNNITDYFTEQVEKVHTKVDLCCPDSSSATHTERPTAGVSMPTPATISTAFRTCRHQWPSGKYTMVKPRVGCPESVKGKRIFYTLPYTLETIIDNIERIFEVSLRSGYEITKLQLCSRTTESVSLIKWPNGSYCIGKSYSTCPEGFSKGEMKQKIMSDSNNEEKQPLGIYKGAYCCRSDGHANVPVTLPTHDPFYLYRYNGKCQEVKGMDVEEDSIFIRKDSHVSAAFASRGSIPDVDSSGNVILCHYLSANQ